jgi:hypothetical protein
MRRQLTLPALSVSRIAVFEDQVLPGQSSVTVKRESSPFPRRPASPSKKARPCSAVGTELTTRLPSATLVTARSRESVTPRKARVPCALNFLGHLHDARRVLLEVLPEIFEVTDRLVVLHRSHHSERFVVVEARPQAVATASATTGDVIRFQHEGTHDF